MNKITITTDSGMDPLDEENMIAALVVKNNKESFRDVLEISPKTILREQEKGDLFRTSSPLLQDYQEKFKEHLENHQDVIHLSMSSGISEGSVNTAHLAASSFASQYKNNVYVIDSLTGATGGTLMNEIAKDMVKQGLSTKEIVTKLENLKRKIQTAFYVPNPEGFIKSGRNRSEMCLKDKALLVGANALKLASVKFRVDFNQEGNLFTKALMRCKTGVGMLKLVKEIVTKETLEQYDPAYVVIGTLEEKEVKMQEVENYLENFHYFKRIINQNINGVVAAYGSPDLGGISLVKK